MRRSRHRAELVVVGGGCCGVPAGGADEQIPAAWTTATYRALRRAGVKTRLVWIPGAPHIMAGADLAGENAAAEAWIRQALGSGASGAAAPRRRSGA